MGYNILTIVDSLVEPPSEPMAFRTVTMLTHYDLDMDILLHTTQEMKTSYYKWMKSRGLMDYVAYILNEFEFEDGVRIDTIGIYPHTIVTKYIRLENQLNLLGQIRSFRN